MADQPVTMRTISWRDFCPWLVIVRAFRLAISLQLLSIATVGVLATAFGWSILGQLLPPETGPSQAATRSWVSLYATDTSSVLIPEAPQNFKAIWRALADGPVFGVWRRLNAPYSGLLTNRFISWRDPTFSLCGAFWTLVVWSWFGAAITRSAALQLTVNERPSLSQLFSHSSAKFGAHLAAPLLPLLLVFVLTVVLMLTTGLLARWDASLWITGVLWGPALILAFTMVVVLLGLYVGWPLMWATISTEGTDAFDALSRSYSYAFQRPLHYLFYTFVAAVVGTLGWFLFDHASEAVIHLASWGAACMAGWSRISEITLNVGDGSAAQAAAPVGTLLIGWWIALVRAIATAFTYSYFWSSMTVIYLLLRHDVDRTEMDEVHLSPQDETYGLPPLSVDEAGVPSVADEALATENDG